MRPPSLTPRRGGFIFMRAGCLGLFIAVALLCGGGQMLYTSLKNRQPLTVTVKEYIAHRPNAEWVHLTDTHVDLAECATSGFAGAISELYIPVRAPGEDRGKQVHVLLRTKNSELVSLMTELKAAAGNPARMAKVVAAHTTLLSGPREVTGLVQFGISSDDKTRSKLAGLHMNLTPDFVIIADGEVPSLGRGLALFGGGMVLGFFMLRRKAPAPTSGLRPPPDLPPRDFGDGPPSPSPR